ncbi:MAG: hypothetical protein M3416_03600 [Acidobacteriota bacterium]|nr:hypothetical protein [Acidobacteriota bacterium]
MSNDSDRICDQPVSADRRAAAKIFLSLTAVQGHEVIVRMGERRREAAKDSAAVRKAAAGGGVAW